MERSLFAYERLMLAAGRPYNILYAVRLSGPVDPDRLDQALGWLQQRHPVLLAGIVTGVGRPRFECYAEPPPIPVRRVTRTAPDDWFTVFRQEVDQPLPLREGPLLRVVLLMPPDDAPSELILVVHHAIADGKSVAAIAGALLARLADADPEIGPPPEIETVSSLFAPPVRQTPAAWRARARLHLKVTALAAAGGALLWTVSHPIARRRPRPVVPSRLHRWELDETTTRALERRGRRERVTSYASLAVIFLRVLRTMRPEQTLNRLVCSVDIRHQFAIRHPELLFTSPPTVRLTTRTALDDDYWSQVRDLNADLADRRRKLQAQPTMLAMERLHGLVDRVVDAQLAARRRIDLSFAHLGNVGLAQRQEATGPSYLETLGSTGSMPWPDTMLITSLRSEGRLRFCLSTDAIKLPDAEAERFRQDVFAMLHRVLSLPEAPPPDKPTRPARAGASVASGRGSG